MVTLPDVAAGAKGHNAPSDPHELGHVVVHEPGHVVACGLTPRQKAALRSLHTDATRCLHDVVGDHPAYTVSTYDEYFAEGTAAWFGGEPSHLPARMDRYP